MPEQYFFQFAWPCTESRYHRGLISKEIYLTLKQKAVSGEVPSRSLLESTYTDAINNMRNHFGEGVMIWTIPNIREYFYNLHRLDLEKKYAHKSRLAVDNCMVHEGIVEKIIPTKGKNFVSVSINGVSQGAINFFNLPIKEGSKVAIHLGNVSDLL